MSYRPMDYDDALRYARKVSNASHSHEDAVHDAWLVHYNQTGRDLFTEHPGYIMKAIKWRIFDKSERKQNGGITYFPHSTLPSFVEIDETHSINQSPPDGAINTREYYAQVKEALLSYTSANEYGKKLDPEILVTVCEQLDRGYPQKEIAKMLNISQQLVSQYKKKIQTLITQMDMIRSPFNGSTLMIKEKITRAKYEANKEKYSDYVYDTERDSDHNEFYQQLVHKTEDYGLLIVEGKHKDL